MPSDRGDDATTAVGTRTLNLHDNLSYRLSMLNALMGKVTQGIFRPAGLTSPQWKVLSVIYAFGPMPASQIAQWVTLDKAAISRAVHQLLSLGLAKRTVQKSDRRSFDIAVTPKGGNVYGAMAEHMAEIQARLFEGLTKDEASGLFELFDLLEARMTEEIG